MVDLNLEKTITAKGLKGRADYSIYENQKMKGWPVLTMIRGKQVARDGKLLAEPGSGKFIHRNIGI